MLLTGSRATKTGESVCDDARRKAEFVWPSFRSGYADRRRKRPNAVEEFGAGSDRRESPGDVSLGHEQPEKRKPIVGERLARGKEMPAALSFDARGTESLKDRDACRPHLRERSAISPREIPARRRIDLSAQHSGTANVRSRIVFEKSRDVDS